MTELTDFTDPTPDLTDDEKDLLREAGADEKLIELCDTQVNGIERNSSLQEVKKYLREWENLNEDTADGFTHLGGGFFTKMWNGNLWKAYGHADQNNKELMKEAFGLRRINNERPAHRSKIQA